MKSVFIGHFSPKCQQNGFAGSAAGNQVQLQILKAMNEQSCGSTYCYSMTAVPAWPRGPLVSKSLSDNSIEFVGFVNLPLLKHIIFSLRLLLVLFHVKPRLCLQYNSYFFENLSLLLFRLATPTACLAMILQDIHVEKGLLGLSRRKLRSFSERLSLWLARAFNIVVPVSSAIIRDFKFDGARCFVFQGGLTDFSENLIRFKNENAQIVEIGVFAGGLEAHNGVDKLVDQWIAQNVEHTLHIFGQGKLCSYVEQAAIRSTKVVYHGMQSEEVVLQWQSKAMWNFCLRYSIGIEQEYFFPSKFFNIICSPGAVITNNFHGLPREFLDYIGVVSDDLCDLSATLAHARDLASPDRIESRRRFGQSAHSWRSCIANIVDSAKKSS